MFYHGNYQRATLSPTAPPIDCCLADITFPQGTHDRGNAGNYHVSSNVTISWEPSACVMTVQYYQGNMLQRGYPNVNSGETINLGVPGSGETEVKIWGAGCPGPEPVDYIWVWVN